MTTYHFSGTVAWNRLGPFVTTGRGMSTKSITDPSTGLTPAGLTQGGVAVTKITADRVTGIWSFTTTDVPAVLMDWGAGTSLVGANELPSMIVTAAAPTDSAVATLLGNPASSTRSAGDALYSKRGDLVFDVRDYGAVGDGTTNDTTAVQNAINAANAAGGGEVFLPVGTFNVQTSLTLYTQVRLRGVRGKSKLLVGSTQSSCIAVSSRTSPSIIDLIIDGNGSTNLNYGVYVNAGSGLILERVSFTNQAKTGSTLVMLDNATTDVRIVGCDFTSAKRGVTVQAASKRVLIDRCRFDTLADYGTFGVSSSGVLLEDVTVSNCQFSNIVGGTPRQPLYFTGGGSGIWAKRIKILGNTLIGNSANFNGGTGNGDMIAAYNLQDSEVANNTVLNGGDVGISVWRSQRTTVTGNVAGHNNTNGIVLWDSTDCTVTGNVCYSNRRDYGSEFGGAIKGGIRVMGTATGNTIAGNRCFNDSGTLTQDYGLVFESGGANNNIAVGNALAGNTAGDVSDLGTGNAPAASKTEVFTSSGTWTKPVGAVTVRVIVIAGGGGGGGGRRGAAGTVRCGGGGGAGGGVTRVEFPASVLTSTVSITVGAGGTSGASAGANDTDGGSGGSGGTSTFGGYARASGGGAGGGGTNAGGSAGIASSAAMFASGAGAAASATGGPGNNGSSSAAGAAGGGSGGGVSAADAASAGGAGSTVNTVNVTPAGTGGAINTAGTAGTSGAAGSGQPGQGSGGGGSSITGAGGAGAAGATYGGGAGGGGASLNGNASGAGGAGGAGVVIVTTYF